MKVNDLLRAQRKPSKQRDTIVFDESARKSYVTGFKRRKDERREVARQENERKARDAKIAARREKREALAFALSGGIVHRTAAEGDDAENAGVGERARDARASTLSTRRHVFEQTLTTTTVTQLLDGSDPAFELHAEETSEALAARLAARRAAQQLKRTAGLAREAKARRARGAKGARAPRRAGGGGGGGKVGNCLLYTSPSPRD